MNTTDLSHSQPHLSKGAQFPRMKASMQLLWFQLLVVIFCNWNTLSAATFGNFTYTDNGTYITITDYPTSAVGSVDIPATIIGKPVTKIGNAAFHSCTGLTSVTIPNSVTSLGSEAFRYCSGLTSVTIGTSVTTIGSSAFSSCTGLTSVTIPNSVTSLGSLGIFAGCSGLKSVSIGSSVTNIGSNCFTNCSGLTNIAIPPSVTSIGFHAFSRCSGLVGITIPNSVTFIDDYAFYACSGLKSVIIGSGVTSLGNNLFAGCTGLTSFTIPSNVTSIGDSTFSGCTGIANVTMPSGLTVIGVSAFSGCTSLTGVAIPSGVSIISNSTFSGCTGLASVTIPTSITTIGTSAFSSCSSLSSVTIPSSVTSIGSSAFLGCAKLTRMGFSGNAPTMSTGVFTGTGAGFTVYYLSGKSGFTSPTWQGVPAVAMSDPGIITHPASAPSTATITVTAIGTEPLTYQWYQGTSGTTTNPVGSNSPNFTTPLLTAATDYWVKVSNAANATGINSNSATVTIGQPPLVTTGPIIWNFGSTVTLTGMVNPNGLATIARFEYGPTTAYGTEKTVTLSPNNSVGALSVTVNLGTLPTGTTYHYRLTATNAIGTEPGTDRVFVTERVAEDYKYITTDNTAIINGYTGLGGSVAIPSVLSGLAVTSIGEAAFVSNYSLISVTIPNSITSVGDWAFADCTSLTSVTVPDSVTKIGEGAFYGCPNLSSVTIPSSVTSIGNNAFSDCTRLTSAFFLGAAPTMGADVFNPSASGFTVYYLAGAQGFSTPAWQGYLAYPLETPHFTSAPPPANGQVGLAYEHTCTATGLPSVSFVVASGSLPDGLTITSGGTISGIPATPGTFTGTITASNGLTENAVQNFSIQIRNPWLFVSGGEYGTVAGGGSHGFNTTAILNATGNPGYLFSMWSGDATGTENPLSVLMDADKTITATFAPDTNDDDDDGLTNYQEIVEVGSKPTIPDTDGDQVKDGDDSFPLDPTETLDTDGDGTGDNADTDDDGDGLSDEDEINIHGTNPKQMDSDGDGLSDPAELQTHLTNPNLADSDDDGLSDGAEVNTHGTLPKVADTDGDGFLDGYEVYTGKSPLNDQDKPALVAEARTAIEFTFPSALGKTYRIEDSFDLATWGTVESGIAGNGGQIQRFYTTRGMPQRFFRVVEDGQ